MSQESSPKKLPRREFLANLLFATGMLSVATLQTEYDLVARRDPRSKDDDGWKLPEDWKDNEQTEGWELPDDLLTPNDPPKPPPRPEPAGGVRPPHIRGKVRPPEPLPGDVSVPRKDR